MYTPNKRIESPRTRIPKPDPALDGRHRTKRLKPHPQQTEREDRHDVAVRIQRIRPLFLDQRKRIQIRQHQQQRQHAERDQRHRAATDRSKSLPVRGRPACRRDASVGFAVGRIGWLMGMCVSLRFASDEICVKRLGRNGRPTRQTESSRMPADQAAPSTGKLGDYADTDSLLQIRRTSGQPAMTSRLPGKSPPRELHAGEIDRRALPQLDGSIRKPSSRNSKSSFAAGRAGHLIYEIEDKRIAKICQTAGDALARQKTAKKLGSFRLSGCIAVKP